MKTASMSMRQRRLLAEMTDSARSTEPCGLPRARSANRLAYIRLPLSSTKYLYVDEPNRNKNERYQSVNHRLVAAKANIVT